MTRPQHAEGVQQRCHRAHRIGTATEAEEEKPIVVGSTVVVHHEGIDGSDIALQAIADRLAKRDGGPAPPGREPAGCLPGADSGMIEDRLPAWIVDQRRVELDDVGVVLGELIGRAVATDDDILSHDALHQRIGTVYRSGPAVFVA